jgi:hypothetical protein
MQVATTVFYLLVSMASYVAFGDGIEEDILKNINTSAMQDILGLTQVRPGPHAGHPGSNTGAPGAASPAGEIKRLDQTP